MVLEFCFSLTCSKWFTYNAGQSVPIRNRGIPVNSLALPRKRQMGNTCLMNAEEPAKCKRTVKQEKKRWTANYQRYDTWVHLQLEPGGKMPVWKPSSQLELWGSAKQLRAGHALLPQPYSSLVGRRENRHFFSIGKISKRPIASARKRQIVKV